MPRRPWLESVQISPVSRCVPCSQHGTANAARTLLTGDELKDRAATGHTGTVDAERRRLPDSITGEAAAHIALQTAEVPLCQP